MGSLHREEYCSQVHVVVSSVIIPPSRPSPKSILYLSNLDDHLFMRIGFDALLVYINGRHKAQNPVKIIRDALSEALNYYYPLAGRVKKTQDGRKLQVECTGEGALFFEATMHTSLSKLGILEEPKLSFDPLLHHVADFEEVPLVIFQVNFIPHTLGSPSVIYRVAKFLNGVVEIARGEVKLSTELKPHQPPIVHFQHDEFVESGFVVNPNSSVDLANVKTDDLVNSTFFFSFDALQRIKQPIAEELKENCSTFEVLTALAWRAKIIALGIPGDRAVRLIFGVDVRRVLKPSLAEGYYGNALGIGCVRNITAQEVVTGSIAHIAKIIKAAKVDKRRVFEMEWLRFNQVDFGWAEPILTRPGKFLACPILMLPPPQSNKGVMMLFCVPPSALKALETEMDRLV
eukprot:PITA_30548